MTVDQRMKTVLYVVAGIFGLIAGFTEGWLEGLKIAGFLGGILTAMFIAVAWITRGK